MFKTLKLCTRIMDEDGKEITPSEAIAKVSDGWHGALITSEDWWGPKVFVLTTSNDLSQGNILQEALETLEMDVEHVHAFQKVTMEKLEYEDAEVVANDVLVDVDFEYIKEQIGEGSYLVDRIHVLVPSRLQYPIFPRFDNRVTTFLLGLDDVWWQKARKEAADQGLQLKVVGNSLFAEVTPCENG